MKIYLKTLFFIFISTNIFSQSENRDQKKLQAFVSQIVEKHQNSFSSNNRDYTLDFDTAYFYFADGQDIAELEGTIILTYDNLGRIIRIDAINEIDFEENLVFKYYYEGNDTKFYKSERYIYESEDEILEATVINKFVGNGSLNVILEYDSEDNLVYGDSLFYQYNDEGLEEVFKYYTFYEEEWREKYNITGMKYSDDNKLIEYVARESFDNDFGLDSTEYFRYENTEFYKDDYSILFYSLVNYEALDSTFFEFEYFSENDYLDYYLLLPIRYDKFQLTNGNDPEEQVATCTYTNNGILETTQNDNLNTVINEYHFNDEGKLSLLVNTYDSEVSTVSFQFNEHGKVSEIKEVSDFATIEDQFEYIVDDEERLIEYSDETFIDGTPTFAIRLEFGYKGTAKENEITIGPLAVYPNPVNQDIFLNMEEINGKICKIKVIDFMGKIVHKSTQIIGADQNIMDISELNSGAYQIQISTGQKMWSGRFIKI